MTLVYVNLLEVPSVLGCQQVQEAPEDPKNKK